MFYGPEGGERPGASPAWAHLTVVEVEARLPPSGLRSVPAFEHGTLLIKLYAPRGTDPQKPHSRDEIYVVASGGGTFVNGARRHAFGPADLLFVPAGVVHRFENFTDDLALWVAFYGPEGGEKP
ncbi:MAG: cupin domain-containing protein [Proteobacteria bacterium]|nr:cupin domain-containing protein [Pseudomonadota bacterium]